ncbi:hypothetical protein BN159_5182 [Streptomyces davaonensis JCM 4913]|uniref:Uncharacterized protein n=1 Tax=Streptomyces davaonensis (strain DSM 101723 / JCM 4913 / KCC S-0913 / 768) TaxID=1214101 RepID=K4QZT3_STRDJ|nr:sel1 repeat family protein [Streptomyces davaonensis]CCK29561.1 hypothetical protein BN159_5182 [Streptomyces davaonensis JCM 4913]
MSGVLDELAGAAAGVLVSSMGDEDWAERAKPAFVRVYAMAMKQDVGPLLEEHRSEVRGGRLSATDVADIWRGKIREAFKQAVIAAEIDRFIKDFRQSNLHSCRSCAAQVEPYDIYCGECGDVLGAPGPAPATAPVSIPVSISPESRSAQLVPDPLPAQYAQDHVDFREARFNNAPVIGVQNIYGTTGPAPADGWPLLGELRRRAQGIRPVSSFGDEPTLPPYIARSRDADLDRLVAHGLREGGLVVVTGEPLAGKTATAWAALERNAGEHTRLFHAHAGADLRELPAALRGRDPSGTYVVWLDDLESHLDERGLVAGLLAQLAHEGVLVLATMRGAAYEAHRFGDHPTARALRGARTVDLTCEWSEAELARLAKSDDPRLVDAVRWRGELGVTQFLSVGPELWEEWRLASRPGRGSGHLLVRAAIDAARCGVTSGLSAGAWEFLINERRMYGSGTTLDVPVSPDDLEWASRPRLGVAGLLVPGAEEGTWRACGTLVADAIRCPDLPLFTPHLWGSMAWMAGKYDLPERAEVSRAAREAVRVEAEAGDSSAPVILGVLSTWAGDDPEARHWWGRVAEEDEREAYMLGRYLLLEQGELAEALPHIQRAAEAGNPEPAQELGFLLLARAQQWLAVAAANGNASAAEVLPVLTATLRDENLQAALARHRAPDATPPAIPGPPLSSERTIAFALDMILGRRPDLTHAVNAATPPDTVKE